MKRPWSLTGSLRGSPSRGPAGKYGTTHTLPQQPWGAGMKLFRMPVIQRILLILVVIVLAGMPASAVSVALDRPIISPGEPVLVSLSGLPDGAVFTFTAEGTYPVGRGETLLIHLTAFTLPFSLLDGEILASAANTRTASFEVQGGNTTALMRATTEDGIFVWNESRSISRGTYDSLRIEADAFTPDRPVTAHIRLTGVKQGPDDSSLTFMVAEIPAGKLRVRVIVDGTEYLDQVITLQGGTGPSPRQTTITSPDGLVTLTSPDPVTAEFQAGTPALLPAGWEPQGKSYILLPADLDLASPAVLSFVIPPELAEEATVTLFIARSGEREYEMLPSRIEETGTGTVITAPVTRPGTYVLASLSPPVTGASPPPTTASLPLSLPAAAAVFGLLIMLRRQ